MAIFTNMKYNATKAILISVCLILACSSDSEADSNVYNPGDNVDENNLVFVTTLPVGNIGSETAHGGGSIVVSGAEVVNSRGLVWSQSGIPTLSDNDGISEDGSGPGSFTSSLTALSSSTMYYVRAYAINQSGTVYGQIESFTTLEIPIPLLELVDSSIYIDQIIDGVNVSREVLLEVPDSVDDADHPPKPIRYPGPPITTIFALRETCCFFVCIGRIFPSPPAIIIGL